MEAIFGGIRNSLFRIISFVNRIYCWPKNNFKGRRDEFEDWLWPYVDPWIPNWVTPNRLGGLRIGLTILICYLLFWEQSPYLALLSFSVAWITDFLDGLISRKRNKVTRFGQIWDPLADKILHDSFFCLCLAFFVFTPFVQREIWVILAADLITAVLGLVAFILLGTYKGSSFYGKVKFGFQCASVVSITLGWMSLAPYVLFATATMGIFSAVNYAQSFFRR